ncbi:MULTISPECIES: ABC transporter permease [unclassified Corynebacterium]|uniref:ABC transporter permease n=1 Tax=unclassified Corynebacterium TaxID=2624378 RepID=UPI0029CA0474|nr:MULTISPECIES: ABC transporter permease [unclassified Corynebacterium]WPF65304.1 ABC transporter permease [Corynebacterium sp. 22KM0430]WPF67799.1 ABC transporter permease [Corynebacterium sp. 21KM1197]
MTLTDVLMALAMGKEHTIGLSDILGVPHQLALIVMIFGGAMIGGAELAKGSIGWLYLSTNRRVLLVVARMVLLVVAFALAATVGAVLGTLILAALGYRLDLGNLWEKDTLLGVASVYGTWVIFTVLAVLLTYALGRGVYAAMILMVDTFLVETALLGFDPSWGQFLARILPLANVQAMTLGDDSAFAAAQNGHLGAMLILVVTVALLLALAARAINRRAVN